MIYVYVAFLLESGRKFFGATSDYEDVPRISFVKLYLLLSRSKNIVAKLMF
jgi:hypothetical protein